MSVGTEDGLHPPGSPATTAVDVAPTQNKTNPGKQGGQGLHKINTICKVLIGIFAKFAFKSRQHNDIGFPVLFYKLDICKMCGLEKKDCSSEC